MSKFEILPRPDWNRLHGPCPMAVEGFDPWTLTASEIATICGVGYDSPYELYHRKRGDIPPREDSFRFRVGHALENVLAAEYAEVTMRSVFDPGDFAICRHPDLPWLICTVDRLAESGLAPRHLVDRVVELKTTEMMTDAAKEIAAGEAPITYQIQVQAQMSITGLRLGSIAAMAGLSKFWHIDLEFNAEFVETMLKAADAFRNAVMRGIEPDPGPRDGQTIRALYPLAIGETAIELPDEAADWAAELEDVKAQIKALEEIKAQNENRLKSHIGTAALGTFPGGAYSFKSSERKEHMVAACTMRTLRRVNINRKGENGETEN